MVLQPWRLRTGTAALSAVSLWRSLEDLLKDLPVESTTLGTKEEPGVWTSSAVSASGESWVLPMTRSQRRASTTSASGSTSTGMTTAGRPRSGAGGLDPAEGDGSGGPLGASVIDGKAEMSFLDLICQAHVWWLAVVRWYGLKEDLINTLTGLDSRRRWPRNGMPSRRSKKVLIRCNWDGCLHRCRSSAGPRT